MKNTRILTKDTPSAGFRSGFTLIELLVVVLIIGILSAVALPQYSRTVEKARAAEMDIWISNAQKAMSLFFLENGGYPSSTVYLTGPTAQSSAIDLSLGNVVTGSTETYNKNFTAHASCSAAKCDLTVYRNKTNPDIAGDFYQLNAEYLPSTGAWKSRIFRQKDESAKAVAQSFKEKGWTIM